MPLQDMPVGPPSGDGGPRPRMLGQRLRLCLRGGLVSGARMGIWLLAIMVPVSLVVTILNFSGALSWLAQGLRPVFDLVGLPAETVVAFLTGVFLNIYSGIAALGSIPLTDRQLTILALMMLISHNFPVEATVQRKAGSSALRMIALRLAASAAGALFLNWVLPLGDGVARARGLAASAPAGFLPLLQAWAIGTAILAGKVVGIVIGLMILQQVLREFGLVGLLSRALAPVLWLAGLPRRTAFLWIVANTLGLAYGAAVILAEAQPGRIGKDDARLLNLSIAICHSLLEDTLLFVAIGAWALWITAPRVALAALAVWGCRAWRAARRKTLEASARTQ